MGNEESFEEWVRLVDEMLLRQSLRSPSFDGISDASLRMIRSGGRARLAALADSAGLSVRQFERKFIQQVVVRPKLFARIARFEAALETKACFASRSWTDVAYDFGYYDQMHTIHDFAEFTGETPTETLIQLERAFVEKIKMMRSGGPSATAAGNSRLIL
jgi:methylphosphotriester-DNA--protein-cysteine methyltransferase